MTQNIGGRLFSDAGQLQVLDGSGGVPAGSSFPQDLFPGWACDSGGSSYIYDLGASAVPATAKFIQGIAFTQGGAMYVSSDAPAASDVSVMGIKVRADGAMRMSSSAVGSSDAFVGGWAVAQTGAARANVSGTVAPTLSSASAGTPTSDGCTGAGVTTNQGNGTLYWAVVTNGGSCTDAQLKAGAGGNIVAGKAGSQAVSSSGAQVISSITGLSASTTYQIKYLQTNASAQDSSQASVSLTTSAASDPYWANVVLLVGNNNGANGSTTFTDQSTSAKTATTAGNTAWTNTSPPTGLSTWIAFDGTGDYVSFADSADWDFGSGDWVIEGFSIATGTGGATYTAMLGCNPGAGTGWGVYMRNSDRVLTFYDSSAVRISTGVISNAAPVHWAVAKTSGNMEMWVSGARVYNTANAVSINDPAQVLKIGSDNTAGSNNDFNGRQVIRITKGSNRGYTGATITVPTLPFPNS